MGRGLFRFGVLSFLSFVALPTACRKDEPAQVVLPAGAVGRCETGIRKALTKPTVREAMSVYYDECADLYTEAGCRDAFHAAAHAEVKDQAGIVLQGCRAAYCPVLGEGIYEACSDGFQLTTESAMRAWPKLYSAILAHEAGAYSGEVQNMLMTLYAYTIKLGGFDQPSASASGAAAAESAAPEGSVAPPSSAAPPASASAAPVGSAAAAPMPTPTAKGKKPSGKP
jgi:hypothetical protein